MAIVVKATMHSGKGNRKHNDHDWMPDNERNVIIKTFVYTGNIKKDPSGYLSNIDIKAELDIMAKEFQKTNKCALDEITLYFDLYGETWHKQNQKHIKDGHKNRCKTMLEWASSKNYSPVEDILQIGNADVGYIPIETLQDCINELMTWEEKTLGKNIQHISIALHLDETTPHCHKRDTYVYWDNEGLPHPCVKKALKQAGIPLPDPSKPESKTNNRKAMYDQMRREAFYDIIEKHLSKDYVLDRIPDPERCKHMSVSNYKDYKANQKEKADLNTVRTTLEARTASIDAKAENYKAEIENKLKKAYTALEHDLRSSYDQRVKELQSAYDQRMSELDDLMKSVSDYKLKQRAERLRNQSIPSLQTNNNDYQMD